MAEQYRRSKIIIITVLVICISFLHYSTRTQQIYHHIFYRELYFLPLVLAGFWFGLRGGIITAIGITALYVPTIVMDWSSFSPDDFGKILETVLFSVVAAGLGFLSDRRKAAERARIKTEHVAREQAESADRLKTDILSIMSHELRTPLISIIRYNDLLLDGVAGEMKEDQVDALKKIDRNSKRLLELINAMLDVSSVEARATDIKDVDVHSLAEQVKQEMAREIEERGLTGIWKTAPGLHANTDPAMLAMIMKNIVANAVKFTEKGEVIIDIHGRAGGIELEVKDTGIGISPEEIKIIFEPFRQAENPLTRRHGGAGLGLYMVRRLLELLDGTIDVESEVGRGSIFRVRIPTEKSASKQV